MVFRRENKADAFQRQISALRQQLGPEGEQSVGAEMAPPDEDDQEVEAEASFTHVERRRGTAYPAHNLDSFKIADDDASPNRAGLTGYTGADQDAADLAPPVPAIPTADVQASVVAHDAVWNGDLRSDGSIHVHGTVEGTITSRQDIFVAEEAIVDATIRAVNIIVAGRVKGSIHCQGRFEALPQGRIAADVRAPALVVHDGASITGGFRMGSEPEAEGAAPNQSEQSVPVVHRRAARGGG